MESVSDTGSVKTGADCELWGPWTDYYFGGLQSEIFRKFHILRRDLISTAFIFLSFLVCNTQVSNLVV